MTREELMKPRFSVIADYPGLSYNVGDIIEVLTNDNYGIIDMVEYPHLFKKLKWWESRRIEDMPKKLIFGDDIIDIIDWDMERYIGTIKDGGYCNLKLYNDDYGYFPID